MPTVDDLVKLIQDTEAAKNNLATKSQAVDAANAAATTAAQAVTSAQGDLAQATAAEAAKVQQVLAMVQTLYGNPPAPSGATSGS